MKKILNVIFLFHLSVIPNKRVQKGGTKPTDYSHGIRSTLGKLD